MLIYPITLAPDTNETLLVGFVDLPGVHSVGEDEEAACINAQEALRLALEGFIDERKAVPLPSKLKRGQRGAELSILDSAKVLIWNEMLGQGLRKSDLARRLDVHMPQVDRLFELGHPSKFDFVEKAASALGKKLSIELL